MSSEPKPEPKSRGRPKGSCKQPRKDVVETEEARVEVGSQVETSTVAMLVHTVQATSVRSLVEALKDVLTDVNLTVDSTGIRLCSMDSTQSALVFASLDASKFEEFHVDAPQVVIGLNVSSLFRLLKTAGNHDVLTLYVLHTEPHSLCVKLTNHDRNCNVLSKLRLLDLDYESYSIPSIDFDSVFVMPSAELQKHVRDLKDIAEKINISCKDGNLKLSVNGDFASQEWTIGSRRQGGISFSKESKYEVSCTFKMKYLVLFTKSAVACQVAEIYLKAGFPMVLRYAVGTLGRIQYAISPVS